MSSNEPPQYPDYGSVPGQLSSSQPGGEPTSPPHPYGTPSSYGGQGYGPPPGAPAGYGGYGGYYPPQPSQKALWAMILGIVSLVICCLAPASIAAIIMGAQAKREIAESGGRLDGAGQAQAGFVLGIIAAVLYGAIFLFYVVMIASFGISA